VENAVHYRSELVTHLGGTYQAKCDTARVPPHEDWACVAAPGSDGRDAASPHVRGTWQVLPDQPYKHLDVVALNGSGFIAKRDDPGPCPGDGWQLIASCGKPGKPGLKGDRGDRGEPGEKGERGLPGRDAPVLKGFRIDRKNYTLVPVMSNGELEPINLRDYFEQYNEDSNG
jgi:hypothetical protein